MASSPKPYTVSLSQNMVEGFRSDMDIQIAKIIAFQYARSGPEVIKLFSCLTQLNLAWNFNCSCNLKCWKIQTFLAFKLSDVVFVMLVNVKMPTFVGILTFMSMINFMFGWVEDEIKFYNLGARQPGNSEKLIWFHSHLFKIATILQMTFPKPYVWAKTWWKAFEWHGDSELLKLLHSNMQDLNWWS